MRHKLRDFFAAALIGALAAGAGAGCLQNLSALDTSDPAVTARVKAELKAHRDVKVQYLDVSTNMGVVTISGMVDSSETRRKVQKIVYRVPGLKQLILNLLVQD
jgi:osmotically-inducible protein OsmY